MHSWIHLFWSSSLKWVKNSSFKQQPGEKQSCTVTLENEFAALIDIARRRTFLRYSRLLLLLPEMSIKLLISRSLHRSYVWKEEASQDALWIPEGKQKPWYPHTCWRSTKLKKFAYFLKLRMNHLMSQLVTPRFCVRLFRNNRSIFVVVKHFQCRA